MRWPWVKIPSLAVKIGSKMGGAPTPKWDPMGFDPQIDFCALGDGPSHSLAQVLGEAVPPVPRQVN